MVNCSYVYTEHHLSGPLVNYEEKFARLTLTVNFLYKKQALSAREAVVFKI